MAAARRAGHRVSTRGLGAAMSAGAVGVQETSRMREEEVRSRRAHARYLELVEQDVARLLNDASVFRRVTCPGCGGGGHIPAFIKFGFQYVTCPGCGSLFANPRLSPAALDEFCLHAPSSRYWIEEFFAPFAEARREKLFRPRAQAVAEQLPGLADGIVGDIGAGFGLFLQELRSVWTRARLVAIEPSPEMAAKCRSSGLEVVEATIEQLQGFDGQFGLLTSFELLEHLHAPAQLFEQARRLLRPGGYLLATTLNGEGFDIQLLWERSRSVFPPHHQNLLTPRAVRRLCEDAGVVVEELSTPGQLDWDIIDGAIGEGMDVDRFWSVVRRQGSDACTQELQAWISRYGLSSHMRVLARKP